MKKSNILLLLLAMTSAPLALAQPRTSSVEGIGSAELQSEAITSLPSDALPGSTTEPDIEGQEAGTVARPGHVSVALKLTVKKDELIIFTLYHFNGHVAQQWLKKAVLGAHTYHLRTTDVAPGSYLLHSDVNGESRAEKILIE